MNNPRKNKRLVKLWLTEAEVEGMKETINDDNEFTEGNLYDILIEAERRQDIIW